MLRSVFTKTLRDSLRSYPWWIGGLAAYVLMMVAVYPTLEELGEDYQQLLENYPEALLAAFGIDPNVSIMSPEGFLGTYFFGWLVPLLFLIYGISFGARAMAGEEEVGTMDLLLANPIGRIRLVLEKFAALAILLLGLGVTLFGSIWIGGLVIGWEMPITKLGAACLSGVLLGLAFGGIAFALGAATGRRPITSGVAAAVAVASYLLFTLGGLVEWLEGVSKASPIWLYGGNEALISGLAYPSAGILVLIAGGFLSIALALFNRRDIRL